MVMTDGERRRRTRVDRLTAVGERRRKAMRDVDVLTSEVRERALQLLQDDLSEVAVARVARVDRATLRAWRGKARSPRGRG